ncbi:TRAP transporter small permease [Hydrogenophaga sp. SL48]|jgi:TRAP-type C4-dicarboxylate transport system permease small subunit|uniref:TRAP transporter small permease n=1 Tax=Hydrogenophaga sp. SL48 TaxID=2806347 RepID=UPI001F30F744|nr:TRAP transporter small permease [Hydrogenophaga sp. SL48]UJW82037.1 TRAP transporter small permease [Hydrogenophaga sp. SL48]
MTSSSPERPGHRLLRWLRLGANHVLVLMMAAMFVAFILQVAFRYALNLPLAWTDEVCTIVWLWGILWGASFVMRNREDIRFDMLYNVLPRRLRRAFTLLASVLIVALLLISLPATWSYVSFMKVESSASLQIPMNWMFVIYPVFVVAMVTRHGLIAWDALNNRLVEDDSPAPTEAAP